jgi:hypothetical protein
MSAFREGKLAAASPLVKVTQASIYGCGWPSSNFDVRAGCSIGMSGSAPAAGEHPDDR